MLKGFFDNVWNRVMGGYKSTLVGVGLAVVVVVLESATEVLNGLPQGWAKVLATLCILAGASLKPKALPPSP